MLELELKTMNRSFVGFCFLYTYLHNDALTWMEDQIAGLIEILNVLSNVKFSLCIIYM